MGRTSLGCAAALLLAVVVLPSMSSAAAVSSSSFLIASATRDRPVTQQGETFLRTTADVWYSGGSLVVAGSSSGGGSVTVDGRPGSIYVDDAMDLVVTHADGTRLRYTHDFSDGCTASTPSKPLQVGQLLHRGLNRVHVRLHDVCGGGRWSTALYLYGAAGFRAGSASDILYGATVPHTRHYAFVGALEQPVVGSDGVSWEYVCSASLVSSTEILTAASCPRPPAGKSFRLVIGSNSLSGSARVLRSVSPMAVDAAFRPATAKAGPLRNDYAIWRTAAPIRSIVPVRLATRSDLASLRQGQITYALGWGQFDPPYVRATDPYLRRITEKVDGARDGIQFRTAHLPGSRQGVSPGAEGGPVLVRAAGGDLVQVGVISGSEGTSPAAYSWRDVCAATYPGAGQRWIRSHL